jgi:putative transposase
MARATYYARRRPRRRGPPRPRPTPRTALTPAELAAILEACHAPRFVDASAATVWATLLDEGVYHASLSTFYRVLRHAGEVRERRAQATHPSRTKPELVATGPNQVWSWDITYLPGPTAGRYWRLYVILDIYSRYVVGWLVAPTEAAWLAAALIRATVRRQGVARDRLTLHADNGAAMASQPVAALLEALGVTKSHSRPHTSNDNPFSEAQFKTLKYRPDFPDRFPSLAAARRFLRRFFAWYNREHRHSGLGWMTPATVHHGEVAAVRGQRAQVLAAAYARHPERFAAGPPRPPALPERTWINPPDDAP